MTADEARKIAFEHSEKMRKIYQSIETSAKRGNQELYMNTQSISPPEMEVLRKNGFSAGYETDPTDGGQYVLIKW